MLNMGLNDPENKGKKEPLTYIYLNKSFSCSFIKA